MNDTAGRLLAALPAIYRADGGDQLRALLAAFELMLLASGNANAPAVGDEIDAIPSLFAPLGVKPAALWQTINGPASIQSEARPPAPDRFMPWLAQWVAFTPYRYFSADELRHIVAGIVPLYGRRGTRDYMEKLLALCFGEIGESSIDENPVHGFVIGRSHVGVDTELAVREPYRFRVEFCLRERAFARVHGALHDLEERVRAVVEFARPAHTEYELVLTRDRREPVEA
ncbi:phage tail protein [Paraburkholderia sp. MMS20-SJTN17]|uniref:Phage tail protein n=1 Tax=Paraburkholderia translucens TaxID=2886945 RepID=A0ABS8K6U8_9BURK|nr:phage tail protein [Paraburkholderia sp. MMS20-SJTN17]MCC8400466.1 phage tail protein [Paraburkholderia sp. MMS20-SJTN17]